MERHGAVEDKGGRTDEEARLTGVRVVRVVQWLWALPARVLSALRETNGKREGLLRFNQFRQFKKVAESLPIIIWAADASGEITYTNEHWRRLTGIHLSHERAKAIGACMNAIHPSDRDRFESSLRSAVATGKPFTMEMRIWSAAGRNWHWHFIQAAPIMESGVGLGWRRGPPRATGWVGSGTDIEEMKKADHRREAKIREVEREIQIREQFISIASHELKTPLTTMLLQMQLLERQMRRAGSSNELKYVEFSLREINRLSILVNDLLDFTRIRGGKFVLEKRHGVSLSGLVEECIERMAMESSRNGVEIRTRIEPGIEGVWDKARLEQVVINLISNAMKYGGGKPVEVSVGLSRGKEFHPRDDVAFVRVKDSGAGIPQDIQELIFHPFQRASAAERVAGGLGLGLFIVRQIVEAHQGKIALHSTPGAGAEFTVYLPGVMRASQSA